MIRRSLGALPALVLVGVLAGCRSAPVVEPDEDPTPSPVEDTKQQQVVDPTPQKPPFDDLGRPVDRAGNLLGRTFYFEYDQARLAQADIRVLASHADILRRYRDRSVRIEGHCDERGSREYNLALGERRAEAVRRYLISAGVRSTQIETVSFGEERPVDPGHDESAWAKNRRAEMIY